MVGCGTVQHRKGVRYEYKYVLGRCREVVAPGFLTIFFFRFHVLRPLCGGRWEDTHPQLMPAAVAHPPSLLSDPRFLCASVSLRFLFYVYVWVHPMMMTTTPRDGKGKRNRTMFHVVTKAGKSSSFDHSGILSVHGNVGYL